MENDGFTPLKKVTESDFRFKASHLWHPASKSVKKRLFYTDIAEIVRWGPNYKKEPPGPSPSLKIRYFCCFVFLGLLGPWKDFFWPRDSKIAKTPHFETPNPGRIRRRPRAPPGGSAGAREQLFSPFFKYHRLTNQNQFSGSGYKSKSIQRGWLQIRINAAGPVTNQNQCYGAGCKS